VIHPGPRAASRCRNLWLACLLLSPLGLVPACEDASHRDIQDEINILTRRNDALVSPATDRLARYGRLAIPQIEVAMHTAAPMGRMHLVEALDRIGDGEAIPVLRHFSLYDVRPEVREACAALLSRWAGAPATAPPPARGRAERARLALAEVARKRAAGEGPLIFQDGTPGAPTVGAPEPVGIELEHR
jgi:hypothetical protein